MKIMQIVQNWCPTSICARYDDMCYTYYVEFRSADFRSADFRSADYRSADFPLVYALLR
jgi:uncharacterized protein YjbI with pentapeptide repeats